MLNKISAIMKKMYENKILEIPDNNNYKGKWDDSQENGPEDAHRRRGSSKKSPVSKANSPSNQSNMSYKYINHVHRECYSTKTTRKTENKNKINHETGLKVNCEHNKTF